MREVGSRIEAAAATVSQIEKGQRALKEPKIPMWAAALEVDETYLRDTWLRVQLRNPDGPIERVRTKNVNPRALEVMILKLTGPERSRVVGYIDALLENREETNASQ